MYKHHIPELLEVLSKENKRELILLGYDDINSAINQMVEQAEVYIARNKDLDLVFVGGVFHGGDLPQMFAMFSYKIKENYKMLIRGSKLFVDFLDRTQTMMCMTILADYEFMLDWASWLGFEAIDVSHNGPHKYVEFVRCNPNKSNVYNLASRPVTH